MILTERYSMSIHPEIPTVVKEHQFWNKQEDFFKPMDIVYSNGYRGIPLGIILMGPMAVPFYHDGLLSEVASMPLDIENADEWQQTFDAYLVYDFVNEDYVICGHQSLHKLDKNIMSAHVPFDLGSGKMRMILGLIEMSNKWHGRNYTTLSQASIDSDIKR